MVKYPARYAPKLFLESIYQTKREIREDIGLRAGMKILDYGCGMGYFLFEVSRYPIFGVGVDTDGECIENVNKIKQNNLIKNLEFLEIDGYHVPYPSSYFDFVMCSHVLEHVANPKAIIDEIHRLLNENGLLLVGTPYKYERDLVLLNRTYKDLVKDGVHFVHGFTLNEIEKIFDARFQIEKVRYTGTTFLSRLLFDMCRFVGELTKIDMKSNLSQNLDYSLAYRILYLFTSFFSNLLAFEKHSLRKGYTIVVTAKRRKI